MVESTTVKLLQVPQTDDDKLYSIDEYHLFEMHQHGITKNQVSAFDKLFICMLFLEFAVGIAVSRASAKFHDNLNQSTDADYRDIVKFAYSDEPWFVKVFVELRI